MTVIRTLRPAQSEDVRARLAARQRPTATLTLCDDQAVQERLEKAEFNERQARAAADLAGGDDDFRTHVLEPVLAELDEAREAFQADAVQLRFQALPRMEFEAMLVAACSLDGITVEEATEYLSTWSDGEAKLLFNTVWDLLSSEARGSLGNG